MRAPSSVALLGTIALVAFVVGCNTNGNVPSSSPKPTNAPTATPLPSSTPTPIHTPTPTPTPVPSTTPTPITTPTPFHTPTPVPSLTPTPIPTATPSTTPTPMYTQVTMNYTLTSSGETITFPSDADATGSSKVPGITTPTVTMTLVESNTPISGAVSSSLCSAPVYWYATLYFNGPTSAETTFSISSSPITFSSPTLITSGHTYGLCVVDFGVILQDDFTKAPGPGPPVSPSGDTVDLKLVIPNYLAGTLPDGTTVSVFFEKK